MSNINAVLVGNPNSGKTTLFNSLTGAKHKVGNWPGVTIEKKEGRVKHRDKEINFVDLPGIYSLFPFSLEEKLSREYILENDVDVIVNIVNASNLERNLYLTLQLIELGKPVILALNMMDTAEKKGLKIDIEKISKKLNLNVVPIIAIKEKGMDSLLDAVINCKFETYEPIEVKYSDEIENKIEHYQPQVSKYNKRWVSIKLLEKDSVISKMFDVETKEDYTDDITIAKYDFINTVLDDALYNTKEDHESLTDKIDNYVTHKYFGIPIFLVIITAVFFLTFNIGNVFVDQLDYFFNVIVAGFTRNFLNGIGIANWMISLIVDGIIGGVGGVLTFVPNIAILFFFISLLEDSGYMARAALVMDKQMRKIGLNGKTFIPMIMGFGCNVPAIMSTRTLQNERDRLIAILINPFMSCGARLPIYILFASVFFPGYEAIVTLSLYLLGILIAVLMAFIFRRTLFKGKTMPFMMELPDYHLPNLKLLAIHVWEKVKGYIIKAGTIIFAASVVIWFVLNYNMSGPAEFTNSFGASLGRAFAPFLKPLGLGDWRVAISLISGIVAKEIVVANIAIVFGLTESASMAQFGAVLGQTFSQLSAYGFLTFVLLYTPCIATVAVIKRETNSWKWTIFSVVYQLIIAWTVAMLIFQVGSLFGL